jgi:HEAT repeat protein
MAASTTDPIERAKLFASFNGLTDQNLLLPLVNGLQDADPVVRQNAADALGSFPDPRVAEWMNHLLQNDTDEAVKREAHKALEQIRKAEELGVVVQ